ncbi:hypothetical protein [Rhizobium leguminosarum]|jgi:hypothetical protein|uniref:hypothetical protein n=1 Tax=Rhizobium leguminosarum TaxID=384 RepID=UPI001C8FEC62|nr:hypothetical protein [Rhizobium leguminosarum]MBY2932705.1 hypothetical protein [Rhizobium leguminosarum]
MPSNLVPRLNKLELIAGPKKEYPKVVRLVVNEGEEQDAYRQAAEMGLDTSPQSKDILVIRLIAASPQRQASADPAMAAIASEHVSALLAAVNGKTRSK